MKYLLCFCAILCTVIILGMEHEATEITPLMVAHQAGRTSSHPIKNHPIIPHLLKYMPLDSAEKIMQPNITLPHEQMITHLLFSSDSNRLITGSGDNLVRLWRVDDGSCLVSTDGDHRCNAHAVPSSDGKKIASYRLNTIMIQSFTEASIHITLEHANSVLSLAFNSDNSKLAATATDNKLRIWDTQTGRLYALLKFPHWPDGVAFSPVKDQVAVGLEDGTIFILSFCLKKVLKAFKGHDKRIFFITFNADGSLCATTDYNMVKIWDTTTWQCMRTLQGHEFRISALAFSPDGNMLATGSVDKKVHVWQLSPLTYFRACTDKKITERQVKLLDAVHSAISCGEKCILTNQLKKVFDSIDSTPIKAALAHYIKESS